jgi:acetyltransferase-like isoleucine patch superfamily enzyme
VTITTNTKVGAAAQIHHSANLGHGAIVHGDVRIGPGVQLGSSCVIEGTAERPTVIEAGSVLDDFVKVYPGVQVGEGSKVGAFSILGHPSKASLSGIDPAMHLERVRQFLVTEPVTRIGAGAIIRSHAVIYANVVIGERLVTGHFIMIREHVRIGNRCIFGTHASCDGFTLIDDRVHIGQYAQLSQGARIGKGAFIGGQTAFSNNIKAVSPEHDLFGPTIEDYARIGLNCTILPSVIIGRSAFVGAGSVVTRDVPGCALAYGVPAKVARQLTMEEVQEHVDLVER